MDDYGNLLSPGFLESVRSRGKNSLALSVYCFFEEESFYGKCVSKAAGLLERGGIPAGCFYGNREELEKALCGESLLAFVDSPEKTGRLALAADALGLSGTVIYGNEISGISLEKENIVTFFKEGSFHSDYVTMSRFAFPEIGDEELQSPNEKRNLIRHELEMVCLGLMMYALGKKGGLLPSMDTARALYYTS